MPAFDDFPVMLVEDSEDDLFFFRRLIAKAGIQSRIAIATDGQQAITHLTAALGPGTDKPPVPRLVFLDLKLPFRSGFEVLQWVRSQPALARTAVTVLSSSAETRDVAHAFELGAQGYVVKYPEPAVFAETLRLVAEADGEDLLELKLPGLPRP